MKVIAVDRDLSERATRHPANIGFKIRIRDLYDDRYATRSQCLRRVDQITRGKNLPLCHGWKHQSYLTGKDLTGKPIYPSIDYDQSTPS